MPNARVLAAAGGLPSVTTRRRALTSLAGFGAALSLPKATRAASLAVAHPDAVLIAHACMVEEMIARCNAAFDRQYALDDSLNKLKPPRPQKVEMDGTSPVETVEHAPDGTVLSIRFSPVDPAAVEAREQHEAAVAAWEAACESLREDVGFNAAEGLADDLYQVLQAAVVDLTPMTPSRLAGLNAKARVAVALDPKGYFALNGWENALIASVARDAAAIGGAA